MNIQRETIIQNLLTLRDLRLRAGQLVRGDDHGVDEAFVEVVELYLDRMTDDAQKELEGVRE